MIIKDLKYLGHCHSSFSFLDSVSTPDEIVKYSAERGIGHVCLTDHGHLSNQYHLFESAKKNNIKAITGIEAYIKLPEYPKETLGHLTMSAYTQQGRKNIYKLFNLSWDKPSKPRWGHAKPVMTWEQLQQYSEGIYVGSGCLSSCVGKHFTKSRPDLAEQSLHKLIEIYGKDNVFAEFMPTTAAWQWDRKSRTWKPNECNTILTEQDYQKVYQLWLWEIAVTKLKLKPVITTDSHFVHPEEHQLQTLVLQASEGGWSFHDALPIFAKEEIFSKLVYLPGHNERLHDEMVENGLEFASKVDYQGHLTDSKIKLPNTFDNEEEEINSLVSNIDRSRLITL